MTSSRDDLDLTRRLAEQIADGEAIDWDAVADAGGDSTTRHLRKLELLFNRFREPAVERQNGPGVRFKFGALDVLEPLGTGSEGEVWRAYDPLLDHYVALKLHRVESDHLVHQFLDEGRRLARLRHPNIVSVLGAAVHDGRAGIWIELIRGMSLHDLLGQHGPFPADEVRGIGNDLGLALAQIHRIGLVHGDIKSQNVMREHGGRIVLLDFGASREFESGAGLMVSGTLHYLAPEVLRGGQPSVASDLYGLGVLLFALLTNAYPYDADDLPALLQRQDKRERRRIFEFEAGINTPPELVSAIDRLLSLDPAKRHSSALSFAASIQEGRSARSFKPRHILLGAIAMLATLSALWFGAIRLGIWPQASAETWEASAAFYRANARGREMLVDGASVAPGDRLTLAFQSNKIVNVYVLDDDGSEKTVVLFPAPGVKPNNPLSANNAYRLPGKANGNAQSWQIASNAHQEEIVVIATDEAVPELEQQLSAWEHARIDAQDNLRDASHLVPDPSDLEVPSASLRDALKKINSDVHHAHSRTWHFIFPHRPPGE